MAQKTDDVSDFVGKHSSLSLSYQTSKILDKIHKHTHQTIKEMKTKRERASERERIHLYVCGEYLIELKTHARNARRRSKKQNSYNSFFFVFQMKHRGNKRKTLSHPVNTHTHIHR